MSQLEFNNGTSQGRTTYFVDVILPVPIPQMFTYRVPYGLSGQVHIGCRVIVQFGPRKILTGIIGKIHETPPQKYEAKYILELLDEEPVLYDHQIEIIQWMAGYYMCTMGEVLNIALPSGLKLSSESKAQIHPEFEYEHTGLTFSEHETTLIEALLKNDTLSYSEISKFLGLKTIYALLKELVKKEAIIIFEEVKEKYKPKKEKRVRLSSAFTDKDELEGLFEKLGARARQEEILLFYLQHVPIYHNKSLNKKGLPKSMFTQANVSGSSLKTLVKNGILEEFEITISRFENYNITADKVTLSEKQLEARASILKSFDSKDIVLLHGITGSGKTEIYISLIEDALAAGNQVLYLLPEIALTTQIVNRLRKIFGDKMGVYHSKFSDNERVEVWKGVLSGRYQFVIGVRSSIFLPFDNLGLMVVDEEHETSYKQFDPAPRYHARDVAMMVNKQHHSKLLLGSATPSIESYYLAQQGQYGLVELNTRYGKGQLPKFIMANMIRERQKKTIKGEFSSIILTAIQETLDANEQAIIFQNRRGYAPYITCQECGWIPKCTNCAVSLTYHQYRAEMKCHYCGYKEPAVNSCEACGSTNLKTMGFGTEKLEEDLSLLFPAAQIQRMDFDTTRKKHSYDRILKDFEEGKIDILVGTQMVSKGLDFARVTLVGVVDIDRMLHFPDFRSFERSFYLTTQVSGRAGRREKEGKVVIQTNDPDQRIIHYIVNNQYDTFYKTELAERNRHHYPPFTRLIRILIKNKERDINLAATANFSNLLKEQFGTKRVLGPQEPVINRIRNEYLMEIWLKLERKKVDLKKVKQIASVLALEVMQDKKHKGTKIVFDVDPY